MMASKNGDKWITQKPSNKMLKEFLHELNNNNNNNNNNHQPNTVPRSRSRSRAAMSSFQKLISSAMKSLRRGSSAVSIPRSLSTSVVDRFSVSKKNRNNRSNNNDCKVKVKDILRWTSSRDLMAEPSQQPLDNETISIATVSDSANVFQSGSVLGDNQGYSSFLTTDDELPCWWGNTQQDNDVFTTLSHLESKEEQHHMVMEDEKEQHSPVSVLNSPFREEIDSPFSQEISDDEFVSSFDKSFANMERTKQRLLQSIRSFESLAGVFEDDDETEIVQVEQEQKQKQGYEAIRIVENEMEVRSREYLSRARGKIRWRGQDLKDREGCIKYMEEEEEGQWSNKFEDDEEKRVLGAELEIQVLSDLVSEILIDYFG